MIIDSKLFLDVTAGDISQELQAEYESDVAEIKVKIAEKIKQHQEDLSNLYLMYPFLAKPVEDLTEKERKELCSWMAHRDESLIGAAKAFGSSVSKRDIVAKNNAQEAKLLAMDVEALQQEKEDVLSIGKNAGMDYALASAAQRREQVYIVIKKTRLVG